VAKRYLIQVAGHNLGILMRKLFGIGTPRSLQDSGRALYSSDPLWGRTHLSLQSLLSRLGRLFGADGDRPALAVATQLAA
jgi:hypothetical protein